METDGKGSSSRARYFFVLQTGIISTVVALFGVYWLSTSTSDIQPMGWYADYVIPVGAVIVGFVAGSGYGLASWFTGTRISRWLLAAVLLLQTGAYVAAEYIDYRDAYKMLESRNLVMRSTGQLPTFFQYYDFKARNFTWKPEHAGDEPEPLGTSGYFFVLLGAAGFILSSLIAPAILMAVPYCDTCERYMTSKVIAVLPASLAARKIKKTDTAALEAYQKQLAETGDSADAAIQRLRDAVSSCNVEAARIELAAAGDFKANEKLPRRVQISLVWCKSCESGRLVPSVLSGHGKQLKTTKLAPTAASAEFVRAMLGQPAPQQAPA